MKLKLKQTSLSIVLSAMTLLAPSAYAEVTAPVGYVKLTFAAESDTPFSLPMNRPKVFSGKVNSITGNEITLASQDLTASAYVYDAMSQKEKFYVLFTGGALEGRSFNVTTNGTDTITVAQEGTDDLASIIGALATATFEVRPHWTLNTLFPGGVGFPAVNSKFAEGSSILFKPNNVNGINHSPSEGYKYVNETGWVNIYQGSAPPNNDRILDRDVFFTLRNLESEFTKNVVGDVPTVNARIPLFGNLINQDSHIAFTFPMSLTLDSSGLASNNNFTQATNKFTQNGDVLYVYDPLTTGYNFSPDKGYFYVENEGWYDVFKVSNGLVAGTTSLNSLGRGFILRKYEGIEAVKKEEKITVPYLPLEE